MVRAAVLRNAEEWRIWPPWHMEQKGGAGKQSCGHRVRLSPIEYSVDEDAYASCTEPLDVGPRAISRAELHCVEMADALSAQQRRARPLEKRVEPDLIVDADATLTESRPEAMHDGLAVGRARRVIQHEGGGTQERLGIVGVVEESD